ncbi:predicted protein [Histoplasma capsulatum H143]|uniref:Uncharacterized protein n=1 Tax=Ajellomyces capsulatus (strain H143) TaxID=544712 RepID=C6H5Z1_AJECH|nr:predicted protein [Histoplasma capsulatum H143]
MFQYPIGAEYGVRSPDLWTAEKRQPWLQWLPPRLCPWAVPAAYPEHRQSDDSAWLLTAKLAGHHDTASSSAEIVSSKYEFWLIEILLSFNLQGRGVGGELSKSTPSNKIESSAKRDRLRALRTQYFHDPMVAKIISMIFTYQSNASNSPKCASS